MARLAISESRWPPDRSGSDSYGLTTFSQPIDEMAVKSIEWLSAPASSDGEGTGTAEIVFAPRLVLRRSVAQGFVPGVLR